MIDYVMNVALTSSHFLDSSGRPIHSSAINTPRSHCETLKSVWKEFYLAAESEEMAVLKAKDVRRCTFDEHNVGTRP